MSAEADPIPVFIVGVPRSGTTLVRLMLDAHPSIACGPEAPWLCAHHDRTIQRLFEYLTDDPLGYCRSFNMDRDAALAATRAYVCSLFDRYARRRGKRRWAEKTPGSAPHLRFLRELFPGAMFVHITRDGMDVAASTAILDPNRADVSKQHARTLDLAADLIADNTPFAAAVRWRHWTRLIQRSLAGARTLTVDYERLVREPEVTCKVICDFIGEPFDPAMLEYREHPHDLPDWEWGSADFHAHERITTERVGVGKAAIGPLEAELIRPVVCPPSGRPEPAAALASLDELRSDRFRLFMDRTNALARGLSLAQMHDWSKVWEYPWLWFNALSRIDLAHARVIDIGSARSVMPWLMAMLGADVTMVETDPSHEPLWSRLRTRLNLDIDWRFVDDESIPLEDACADLVTSFSVIEHQADRARAIDELARVLRPGGVLAMSFDVWDSSHGVPMTFPASNGRAMTLAEFERDVWLHEAFGGEEGIRDQASGIGEGKGNGHQASGIGEGADRGNVGITWNIADMAPFHAWHKATAPHHDYVVAAAVLTRAGQRSEPSR